MKPHAPAHRKCLRVTRLISAAQDNDDALSLADRLTMRLHLQFCPDCRNFKHNTETLRQIMKHYANSDETGQASVSEAAPLDAGSVPPPHKGKSE